MQSGGMLRKGERNSNSSALSKSGTYQRTSRMHGRMGKQFRSAVTNRHSWCEPAEMTRVRYDERQTIRTSIGHDEHFGAGLRRRIWIRGR